MGDPEVDSPVLYLEGSGPGDPERRDGPNWKKVEPSFRILHEYVIRVLLQGEEQLPHDMFELDTSPQKAWTALSSGFSSTFSL